MSRSENTTAVIAACDFHSVCLSDLHENSLVVTSILITSILNLLCSVGAVLENALVISAYYFYTSSRLTRPSNTFIFGLALTDFLTGLVSGPVFIIRSLLTLSCNPSICVAKELEKCFIILFAGASLTILCLVSADRYLAILKSLRYPTLVTNRRVVKVLVVTMTIWLIYSAISFTGITSGEFHSIFGATKNITFLCFNLGVYLMISREIRRVERNQIHLAPENMALPEAAGNIRERKAARSMGYISGCVLLSWFPSVVYGLSKKALVAKASAATVEVLWDVVATCFFISSVVNPLLYSWRNEELRISMMRILNRLFPCLRRNVVVPFIVPIAFVTSATPRANSARSPLASPNLF